MDRESSGPDVEAFLRALSDELLIPPDHLSARRHVSVAAAVARSARGRHQRTRIMVRKVAAVAAAFALIGTGGLATAGALPAPIQNAFAQVADVSPLPIYVPYPETEDPEAPEQVMVPDPEVPQPTVIVETTITSEESPLPTPTTTAIAPQQDSDGASACGDECRDRERHRSSDWSGSHDPENGRDGDSGGESDDAEDQRNRGSEGRSDDNYSNDRRAGDDRKSDEESGSRDTSDDEKSADRGGTRRGDDNRGAGDEDDGHSGRRSEEGGSTQGSSWVGP